MGRKGRLVVGATVSVSADGRTVWRDVRPGYSYLASNDHRVHVGLGSATDATVVVHWPDGSEQDFGTLSAGEIELKAMLDERQLAAVREGLPLDIVFDRDRLHLFDTSSGARLDP